MSGYSSSTSFSSQIDRHAEEENREAFDEWLGHSVAFDWPCEDGGLGGTIEVFLERFVPSDASPLIYDATLEKDSINIAKSLSSGPLEAKAYEGIATLFNGSQEGFDSDKKIIFEDIHSRKLPVLTLRDSDTGPDILGAYPGQPTTPEKASWSQYCLMMDVNPGQDIIDINAKEIRRSLKDEESIARLLQGGRNILSASSSCYAFVIGAYLETQEMRIYRIDRSGCVSCAFNYVNKPHIIRQFLWRLVNPHHKMPNTVVGWDETIRVPTRNEVNAMKREIDRLCPGLQTDRALSRWVKVRINLTAFKSYMIDTDSPSSTDGEISSCRSYSGEQLQCTGESYVNTVSFMNDKYYANIDDGSDSYDTDGFTFGSPLYLSSGLFSRATFVTRILVEVPRYGYHVFALKDAWRERNCKPESAFYERIHQYYSKLKMKADFDWVRKIHGDIDKYHNWIPGLAEYYGYLDLSDITSPRHSDDRGHTTVTRRLVVKDGLSYERSRSRILTGPIGSRLENYSKTNDLVAAIRDAVIGHFISLSCGVLHRDISAGNILIAERCGRQQGFLHDFDHATFIPCNFQLDAHEKNVKTDAVDLESMTGTFHFMAHDVLEKKPHMPHHDLESFYWVLIWILLRHPHHNHEDGVHARTAFFDHPTHVAVNFKVAWLATLEPLLIRDDEPLNTVLKDLHRAFMRTLPIINGKIPTHHEIAGVLHQMNE